MWAVIATVFACRDSYQQSMTAAVSRLAATAVSPRLPDLPSLPALPTWAMAALIGASGRPGGDTMNVLAADELEAAGRPDPGRLDDDGVPPFFLARLNPDGPPACSPEATQLLLRSNWPGNTEQLWQVLRRIVQHRRTGTIHPGDLPPECWSVSRRLLSPLESIQRDAIVQSLLDHQGNKARAAGSLGMSRATIYRKIRDYAIC